MCVHTPSCTNLYHDQFSKLLQIQKVSELTGVPLVSCRPWLCMPRKNRNGPPGPLRPVAALLPQHLQMSICEVRGDDVMEGFFEVDED